MRIHSLIIIQSFLKLRITRSIIRKQLQMSVTLRQYLKQYHNSRYSKTPTSISTNNDTSNNNGECRHNQQLKKEDSHERVLHHKISNLKKLIKLHILDKTAYHQIQKQLQQLLNVFQKSMSNCFTKSFQYRTIANIRNTHKHMNNTLPNDKQLNHINDDQNLHHDQYQGSKQGEKQKQRSKTQYNDQMEELPKINIKIVRSTSIKVDNKSQQNKQNRQQNILSQSDQHKQPQLDNKINIPVLEIDNAFDQLRTTNHIGITQSNHMGAISHVQSKCIYSNLSVNLDPYATPANKNKINLGAHPSDNITNIQTKRNLNQDYMYSKNNMNTIKSIHLGNNPKKQVVNKTTHAPPTLQTNRMFQTNLSINQDKIQQRNQQNKSKTQKKQNDKVVYVPYSFETQVHTDDLDTHFPIKLSKVQQYSNSRQLYRTKVTPAPNQKAKNVTARLDNKKLANENIEMNMQVSKNRNMVKKNGNNFLPPKLSLYSQQDYEQTSRR